MRIRRALALAVLASSLLVAGCGGGDNDGVKGGQVIVRRGGSGSVYFPNSLRSLAFDDSVTVAVGTSDPLKWTLFTYFGMTDFSPNKVPAAVLVTFIDGRAPTSSSSVDLPSSVVGIVLHDGFNQGLVMGNTILAQDAARVYATVANGTFVLEPLQAGTDGSFAGQSSPDRQARYASVTLSSGASGDEVLINGSVPFALTASGNSTFLGYNGNLGLYTPPDNGSTGPPDPPGGGGGGGGTTPPQPPGGGGTDGPPAPPL